MYTKMLKATKTDNHTSGPRNMYFTLTAEGFIGRFRIHYSDASNKNDVYKTLKAMDVYFEGMDSNTSNLQNVIDTCLLVERHKQWFLERLEREGSFDIKN